MPELSEEIRRKVLEEVDLSRDVSDEEILRLIRQEVMDLGASHALSLEERFPSQAGCTGGFVGGR